MKKKLIFSAIILIVVAAGLKFTVFKSKNEAELGYAKEVLKIGSIQALVDTTGTLNAVTMVDIGSQVSGKLLDIFVDFNSEVKADQVIAKIDPELFVTKVNQNQANYQSSVAALEKSKVSLANTKKKLDRAINLFERDLISHEEKEAAETTYYSAKADLQSSEARLEQAESQLNSSKVDLAYTIIKSPIDGVVINRNVNIGQTVAASFQAPVLFQVANDLTKMQVECSVDEADIGKVKEGQQVRFTVDAYPNENFSGSVQQVRYSPEVVSNVVTYTTIVAVENPELKLRPGMTATVSIVVGEARNKLLVANSALRFNPELSQEEMRAMFMAMRGNRSEGNSPRAKPDGQIGAKRQAGGGMGSRMRDMARVWYEDENGELKIAMLKTGVTDNIYTEVLESQLKEGQEVIIGKAGSISANSSNNMRGGPGMMRFMR